MSKAYQKFLEQKSQMGGEYGFAPLWMPDNLFDFQKALVEWALRKGRGALFEDCGLGKSFQQLVWAENIVRKTNKRILILTPLAVSAQTIREAEKFGIEAHRSRDGKLHSGINVTNYERLHLFDPKDFAGVVCDESSIMKHFSGATQKQVTRFMSKHKYRLLCTATAAPNDYIELGTSSEALGELSYSDMLSRFFAQTDNNKRCWMNDVKVARQARQGDHYQKLAYRVAQQIGQWQLKPHAELPFWQWVCSWARACRKPSDLGFDDGDFNLPPLIENHHVVEPSTPPEGMLFTLPAFGLNEERAERRRTLQERSERAAELVEPHDRSVVWCHLNVEGDMLEKIIPDAVQVKGSDDNDRKEEVLQAFAEGQIKRLVIKPKIGAYGVNWQICAHVVTYASHCYDEITEVLTKRGWLSFGDVLMSDEIATVNADSLAFEWQHPTSKVWNPYTGPMVYFGPAEGKAARSFDLLVTPNHRMVVKQCPIRHSLSSGEWQIKTASWLVDHYKKQEYRMLSAPAKFHGEQLTEVRLPDYPVKPRIPRHTVNKAGNNKGMAANSLKALESSHLKKIPSLPIDIFVRLAGWYLTEGYCGHRNGIPDGQITIYQTDVNPSYRKEIIDLLRSIGGLNVYTKTKDIRCCSMQLATFLVDQFGHGSHSKRIPMWVKELSTENLILLRDTMLKGDGCSHTRGGQKWFYRTVSRGLADDFAEICLKTGVRASTHYRKCSTGRYSGHGVYDVNIARLNIEPAIHNKPRIKDYTGMIGCVTVPNGTLIVRRNGIPVVSGNSFEQYYQSVRRCWRFGQTRPVTVDIISTTGEVHVRDNMTRKSEAAAKMFEQLVAMMNDAQTIRREEHKMKVVTPVWI